MTPATKRLRDPRLPAGTAEDVCDDHAAVALDERPDDGVEVSAAAVGAICGRCAEEAQGMVAPLDLDAIDARATAAASFANIVDRISPSAAGLQRTRLVLGQSADALRVAAVDIHAMVREVRRLRALVLSTFEVAVGVPPFEGAALRRFRDRSGIVFEETCPPSGGDIWLRREGAAELSNGVPWSVDAMRDAGMVEIDAAGETLR